MRLSPVKLLVACLVLAACTNNAPPPRAMDEQTPSETAQVSEECRELPRLVTRVKRGYVRKLSPDINLIPREPNYIGTEEMPVHSGPWDYLAHVPLVIYGPGFVKRGTYQQAATMADLAPTTASLIGFDGFQAPDGRVLTEALKQRPRQLPQLAISVVWDGGGNNVLDEHPDAHPFLDRLTKRSATWSRMEIGSSPSVTPPIHTTLSTGAWPKRHGIPALRIRTADGEYVDPFLGLDPSNIRLPTLADVYDKARGNRPSVGMLAAVNWHLGMIGQGLGYRGGDRDQAVLFDEEGATFTNTELFSLPAIEETSALLQEAERLDARDGKTDGLWRDHDLSDPLVRYSSPAHIAYEQWLLERLIKTQDFDEGSVPNLLYVNFKPLDDAGHKWGMTSNETAETLRAQDAALQRLFRFLDRKVGRKEWVLLLTADHGQTPYPRESGAWPIGGGELAQDANKAVDHTDDGIDVVDQVSSPGAYLNFDQLQANDLSIGDVARWMAGYTVEENLKEGDNLPARFSGREDELLFSGVVASGRLITKACS